MKIYRYALKNPKMGEVFGEHYSRDSLHHRWLFGQDRGKNKIGISKCRKYSGLGCFETGLMEADIKLLVTPDFSHPRIERVMIETGKNGVYISEVTDKPEFVYGLIRLFKLHNTLHLYQCSARLDGKFPDVYTFSPRRPSREIYFHQNNPAPIAVEISEKLSQ